VTLGYTEFLRRKAQVGAGDGFDATYLPDWLFSFQRDLVEWAVGQGRAALFEDCGMGKCPQSLVWSENVRRETGKPVLFVAPLAVSFQVEAEGEKFGIEAVASRDGSVSAPITVTNYERLEHFDPEDFGGVVCDESSCIKSFDGKRRALVTRFMRRHRYRLLCTATAAPNDYVELGTSSEALGYLGHVDMLNRFFTNDQKTSKAPRNWDGAQWRFKGHAEEKFWRWVASWARALRRPSDLGYEDGAFVLPPLVERTHVVEAHTPPEDRLFELSVRGLREEREEQRRTLQERCEKAAEALADAEIGIAWCHRNDESKLLTRLMADSGAVEIAGSDHPDAKEEKLLAFSRGEIPRLVTKPSVAGWGMNWQHCHRMTYFPSHSYEQMYQAIRRCLRFGQRNPVEVDFVTTEGGSAVLKNLKRKADQSDRMFDALVRHMREGMAQKRDDSHNLKMEVPDWLTA